MVYFSFQNPTYLYLLFLISLVIFLHFYFLGSAKKNSLKFANFEAIARIKGIPIYSKGIGVLVINIIIILLTVFFISGLTLHKEMDASTFSYIIAIDSSQSMGATDIPPTRLSAAKEVSTDFINALPSESRVGIISFAGNTLVEQKISKNKDLLKSSIKDIKLNEFGGTDVYEAIIISINLLENEENKAVIILSDGQINIGNIENIIEIARENDIVIHTIGMGTIEGGLTTYGISKLDEDKLKALSYNTNGNFFKISNLAEMREAFNEIINLKTKIGSIDLTFYLGISIIIFIFIQQIFINRGRLTL